eukprot:jgi/Astpho2/5048/Aster-x0660
MLVDCRRAGNRAAAGRLRERRLQATKELEAKCETLEAEKALHRRQLVELLAYCKAVMTDNHCMATRLISLGVAVPGLGTAAMPEGPLCPIVAPVVPSMSSTASPFGDLLDSLMTGLPAATQPPRPGLPLVTEGLPSLSPAAEASALLPSLPTLSEHVAEMMAGAMQGSQEDWPSFHRLQGLHPSVGAPFGANDMSAASIGQPLI